MIFKVVLEQEDDGRYSVHCPAIKGCHSWGNTKQEALENIQEAAIGCLEVLNQKIDKPKKKKKMSEIAEIAV